MARSRPTLPAPPPPLPPTPQLPLDPENNPQHRTFLDRVQAGILRDHGRAHVRLVFFKFTGTAAQGRAALRAAGARVTTALGQFEAARARLADPGTVVVTFALTGAGLARCGVASPDARAFNTDTALSDGMAAWAKRFADPAASTFDPPFKNRRQAIHAVWSLAGNDPDRLDAAERDLQAWGREFAAAPVGATESGGPWRPGPGPKPPAREPFGFVDGISGARFFKKDGPNARSVDLPLSQFLLTDDPVHFGGSYLVVRKLEQDVRAFRAYEEILETQIPDAQRQYRGHAGALLMGRRRDGTPLVDGWDPARDDLNDFDFKRDPAARRCPFDAHIRKANPRFPGGDSDFTEPRQKAVQLLRRSFVFGRERLTLDGPEYPADGVGIWFMAYMRSIEAQFAEMMTLWLGSTRVPVDPPDPQTKLRWTDPLLFAGRPAAAPRGGPVSFHWQGIGGDPRPGCPAFADFVRCKGGEFFYMPSPQWLRGAAR